MGAISVSSIFPTRHVVLLDFKDKVARVLCCDALRTAGSTLFRTSGGKFTGRGSCPECSLEKTGLRLRYTVV